MLKELVKEIADKGTVQPVKTDVFQTVTVYDYMGLRWKVIVDDRNNPVKIEVREW